MPDGLVPFRRSIDGRRRRRSAFFAAPLGAATLLVALLALAAPPASAHGRLGAAEGQCRLFIGPDYMKFTGYLPDASKNEFCEDIPSTGHMIIALDAEQDELREMAIDFRIVKDVGGAEKENADLDAVTVAYRPPRVYPTGTINFEHVFPEAGYFVGIVTATGPHGERWVSRFPFSVGESFMRTLPYYILMAMGVVGVFFAYLKHSPKRPAKAPSRPEPEPAE
ncbi:MAG TPA: hypothetical protein VIG55_14505 [Methylosinus sp.]|jgi:hypothetical protein